MGKFEWLGILSILSGILVGLFQGISSMMTTGKIVWIGMTLTSLFGENAFPWIDRIDFTPLKDLAVTMVNMQLMFLLIVLGVVFFIGGMLFKRL